MAGDGLRHRCADRRLCAGVLRSANGPSSSTTEFRPARAGQPAVRSASENPNRPRRTRMGMEPDSVLLERSRDERSADPAGIHLASAASMPDGRAARVVVPACRDHLWDAHDAHSVLATPRRDGRSAGCLTAGKRRSRTESRRRSPASHAESRRWSPAFHVDPRSTNARHAARAIVAALGRLSPRRRVDVGGFEVERRQDRDESRGSRRDRCRGAAARPLANLVSIVCPDRRATQQPLCAAGKMATCG